mmetsp:Transcript_38650/g.92825  ORF Transcript_38650/g.92825 Transcript_38650/m.92825 type:complete len:212 (-) Transcript_38650:424-1059(-)
MLRMSFSRSCVPRRLAGSMAAHNILKPQICGCSSSQRKTMPLCRNSIADSINICRSFINLRNARTGMSFGTPAAELTKGFCGAGADAQDVVDSMEWGTVTTSSPVWHETGSCNPISGACCSWMFIELSTGRAQRGHSRPDCTSLVEQASHAHKCPHGNRAATLSHRRHMLQSVEEAECCWFVDSMLPIQRRCLESITRFSTAKIEVNPRAP